MGGVAAAALLGVVQGLTEFLPISSSGHLLILHRLLPGMEGSTLAFDVWLHAGTLLALLAYFWRDLISLVRSAFLTPRSADGRLAWQIVAATIPVVVVALLGGGAIEANVRNLIVVAVMLVLGSILLLAGEKFGRQISTLTNLGWGAAIGLGIVQAFALLPGLSRSGVVIAVALLLGLRRPDATRFAFLLAVPATLGAVLFQWSDIISPTSGVSPVALAVGFFVAAVAGYAAVAGLLAWVRSRSLAPFAWYRVAVALLAVILYGASIWI
jgi:undecaprenyl-diphosphatase